MKLTVSWPRPPGTHDLLSRPKVLINDDLSGQDAMEVPVQVDDRSVVARVFVNLFQQQVHLRVRFDGAPPSPAVLAISQFFTISGGTVVPTRHRVPDFDARPQPQFRDVPGLHPLLTSTVNQRTWNVGVTTKVVDVTAAFGAGVRGVKAANRSAIRVLARTDGVVPAFWVTCTPRVCRGAPAGDLLCWFTSPVTAGGADIRAQMADGPRKNEMRTWGAVFLGQGAHQVPSNLHHGEWFLDHFSQGPQGQVNFVLARGWEQALVDSGRHVALVMPFPASGGHGLAGSARLPRLLRQVHDVLRAVGDVTPPPGGRLDAPRLGLAAHSAGSSSLFKALRALQGLPRRPGDPFPFSDLFLFDPNESQANQDLILKSPARVCFAGFSPGATVGPFRSLMKGHPPVRGRLSLLPKGYGGAADPAFPGGKVPVPDRAKLAEVRGRSPRSGPELDPRALGHAVDALAAPAAGLLADPAVLKRMEHQYIVFGGDDEGVSGGPESHFLTQALRGSTFR